MSLNLSSLISKLFEPNRTCVTISTCIFESGEIRGQIDGGDRIHSLV